MKFDDLKHRRMCLNYYLLVCLHPGSNRRSFVRATQKVGFVVIYRHLAAEVYEHHVEDETLTDWLARTFASDKNLLVNVSEQS